MDNSTNLLITLTDGICLIRCALKVPFELPGDCLDFPLETENKKYIYSLLPEDIREIGKIVQVESLEEIIVKESK